MKLQDCIHYPNTQCPDGCCLEPENEQESAMAAPEHITDEQVEELGLAIKDEVKGHSAIVRPGDSIIIFFDFRLTMQQYEELREFCKTVLPGVNVIALPEVKDIRVFRPKDPEDM